MLTLQASRRGQFEWAKWAAVVLMVVNHATLNLAPGLQVVGLALGRPCFAIFASLVVLALSDAAPSRTARYLLHLTVWGLISQAVYAPLMGPTFGQPFNALISLALGVMLVQLHQGLHPMAAAVALLLFVLGADGHLDGGTWVPASIYLGWLAVRRWQLRPLTLCVAVSLAMVGMNHWHGHLIWPIAIASAAAPLILLASVRMPCPAPRVPGWLFYAFYPAHLAVILALSGQ